MLCALSTRLPIAASRRVVGGFAAPAPVPRAATITTRAQGKEQQPQEPQRQAEEATGELQPRQRGGEVAPAARGGDLMDLPLMMPTPFRRMADHMMQMQREMDSLMGAFGMPSPLLTALGDPFDIFDRAAAAPLVRRAAPGGGRGALLGRLVPLEVEEDEKGYTVTAEVPGFDKSEIKVSLSEDGMLTMTGSHEETSSTEAATGSETATGKEGGEMGKAARGGGARRFASFVRSVQLPEDADRDAIRASTEHGVLTVHIPKTPKPVPKVREIPVA